MIANKPIVEGAWYELLDNGIAGRAFRSGLDAKVFTICGYRYDGDGTAWLGSPRQIRQVFPSIETVAELGRELVRELRQRSCAAVNGGETEDRSKAAAYDDAADLIAAKLDVDRVEPPSVGAQLEALEAQILSLHEKRRLLMIWLKNNGYDVREP